MSFRLSSIGLPYHLFSILLMNFAALVGSQSLDHHPMSKNRQERTSFEVSELFRTEPTEALRYFLVQTAYSAEDALEKHIEGASICRDNIIEQIAHIEPIKLFELYMELAAYCQTMSPQESDFFNVLD